MSWPPGTDGRLPCLWDAAYVPLTLRRALLQEMLREPVDKDALLRMQQLPRLLQRHELCLVNFPRSTFRRRVGGSGAGEAVHAFATLTVIDLAQRHQCAGNDSG